MANLATRVLRCLVQRGHAMLICELEDAFPAAKQAGAVAQAVDQLKTAKCITWTTQGWLATDEGKTYIQMNTKLMWERDRRRIQRGVA